MARVALYLRCSTDLRTPRASGSSWRHRQRVPVMRWLPPMRTIWKRKRRDRRPGLAAMLKASAQRHHDIVAVHAVDRIARSMTHLLSVVDELHALNVDLYIHAQGLDTRTPSGRAMFLLSGVFAELERSLIVARINSGLALAKSKGVKLGRPRVPADTADRARDALRSGMSVRKAAQLVGLSVGATQSLRAELAELGQLPSEGSKALSQPASAL